MQDDQKTAKVFGLICTLVYLALFFLSFYAIIFLPSLYGNPDMTSKIGVLLVFLSLLPPLSIVISIGLIWNRYFSQDYLGVYISCLIPIATIIFVVVLMKIIQVLFL
jgi:hypothetical protein